MKIDPVEKLRNLLQVLAFCLAVSAIQYAFLPDKPYVPPMVYSLLIGSIMWAYIDFGRHLFPSSAETGWPRGLSGVLLAASGIVVGYLLGSYLADQLCRHYGWYQGSLPVDHAAQQRTSILITALAGLTAVYYFYASGRSAWLERKMGEAHRHANEARLKLLETQLEPHMLFNTLANLRALIGADPRRAQTMLDHMIAYLRATLGASRTATHPLAAEYERLRDYLELMAIRMGPRLRYQLELPPELANLPVPTLLLQPLVENSIQHGLEPKVEGGTITVSARLQQGLLELSVTDTGVGMADTSAATQGFGLAQVRERLATLHGAQASVAIDSLEGSRTRVTLRFPATA